MTKKYIFLLLCLIICLPSRSQMSTATTNVLTLPTSVHATAMGGENVSTIADDPALMLHNPALLANVSHNTLALDFMTYAAGTKQMGAEYVRAFGERHTGGVFARYLGFGSMDETASDGSVIGTFSPKDIVIGAGYSYLLSDRWSGGANLKMAYSSIADFSTLALAVDVGVNYYNPDKDFSFGAVARNVGAQIMHYNDLPERMPFSLQMGMSTALGNTPLRLNLTAVDLTRWRSSQYCTDTPERSIGWTTNLINHFVVGLDYTSSNDLFWLSLGYNFRRAYELKASGSSALAGLTVGGGLHVKTFSFGVSYARYHRAFSSLMFNASYSF